MYNVTSNIRIYNPVEHPLWSWKLLTIFTENSIIDVWNGPKYASALSNKENRHKIRTVSTSVRISQTIRTIISAVNVWDKILKNQNNLKVSSLQERYKNQIIVK